MSTGLRAAQANAFLDSHAAAFPFIQRHTGDPGAAGTANVASDARRVQADWASAANGAIATDAETRWDNVTAAEDYTHWTGWSLASGGACGWSGTITADGVLVGNNFVIDAGDLTYTMNTMG